MIPITVVLEESSVAANSPTKVCFECGVEHFDTSELVVRIETYWYHAACAIRVGKRIIRRAEDAAEQFPVS